MTLIAELGRQMGKALSERMDFDVWSWYHGFLLGDLKCTTCGKQYKKRGWFIRHMRRTRHFMQEAGV